jgi:hypothetical protein
MSLLTNDSGSQQFWENGQEMGGIQNGTLLESNVGNQQFWENGQVMEYLFPPLTSGAQSSFMLFFFQ